METKSAIVGGLSALAAVGIAFGGFAVANADTQPAPAPVSTVVTTEAPAPVVQEPVVTEPAPEPTTEAPAPVEVAPAPVVEPVAPAPVVVEPAPVYVAPEPVYVAPEPVAPAPVVPAPQQTYIATNTDAKVAVDANGYIIGGKVLGPGDGGGKVDMPSK